MGEKKEMMASIISTVSIVVGIIGVSIIAPTITTLTTDSGALTSSDFATAKTVVEFIVTFVALGILISAIGGMIGPGSKIVKVAQGNDLNIKDAIIGIVTTVVGVIGISIFAPMIQSLIALPTIASSAVTVVGGPLCSSLSVGDALATAACEGTFATARTIVTFIPVFYAITILVGAISTIAVGGKIGLNYARGR